MGIQTRKNKNGEITAYIAVIYHGGKNNRTFYDYSTRKYGKYAEILAKWSFECDKKFYNYWFCKEDLTKNNENRWYITRHIENNTKTQFLHRFLMNPEKDKIIDHIDGNGLNNRRSNLRIVTNEENMSNRANMNSNNKSGYKGVSFDSTKNSWRAAWIGKDKKKHSKNFSANLYGYNEAKELAIKERQKHEKENNYLFNE